MVKDSVPSGYSEETSKWKWLVLIASFTTHVLVYGIAWGAGVFQMMFMDVFGGEGMAGFISIIPTLVASSLCFVGPVVSALVNRLGCRVVTGLGSLLMSTGFILSSFANSVWFLYATFAIIGVGCGLAFIPSVVIVCDYFEKKRPLAVAIASSGLGVGVFIVPPVVQMLNSWFQWHGALLILGAITLHATVSAAIYRPVPKQHKIDEATASRKRKILRVKMLKEVPFLCLILNQVMCLYGMVAFYIHLPGHLQQQGYTENEAALFISVTGAATMVSRVLCGVVIQKINSPISIYATSMAAGAVAVFSVPFSHSTPQIFAACLVFGLGTATLGPSLPLILAQLVGSEAIGDGYGYILVAEGIGSITGPPVSGFLFDASHDYSLSICVAGAMMFLGSALLFVPIYAQRKKRKLDDLVQANIAGTTPDQKTVTYFRNLSQRPLLLHSFSEASTAFSDDQKRLSQEMEVSPEFVNFEERETFSDSSFLTHEKIENEMISNGAPNHSNSEAAVSTMKPKPSDDNQNEKIVVAVDIIPVMEKLQTGRLENLTEPTSRYIENHYGSPCGIEAGFIGMKDPKAEDIITANKISVEPCLVPMFHLNDEL